MMVLGQIPIVGGDFVDLRAWQESAALVPLAARAASRLRGPGSQAIANQIVRAALSVPANIAEGHGRGRGKDGARFLRMARASAAELESHLRVAVDAGYLARAETADIIQKVRFARFVTSRLLAAFERTVPRP